MRRPLRYTTLAWVLLLIGCLGRAVTPDLTPLPETNYYEVETSYGTFVLQLSDETPIHRDNFKKLVAEEFYDGTTFHRVIRGFMIQGGDPNSLDADRTNDGQGGPGYTLPAEIVHGATHALGALAAVQQGDTVMPLGYRHTLSMLAAARQGGVVNPERRSNGSQFYIVTGERARHLDGQYTIFGRVVEGRDVLAELDQVLTMRTRRSSLPSEIIDRPLKPVRMSVRPRPDYLEAEG